MALAVAKEFSATTSLLPSAPSSQKNKTAKCDFPLKFSTFSTSPLPGFHLQQHDRAQHFCSATNKPPLAKKHTCRTSRKQRLIEARASADDFDFSGGPIEDVRPTFTREAYEVPPPEPPKVFDNPPRKRKGRPMATPPQAIAGSIIAAGCCVALFNFVRDSYFHLVMNPLVRHAPFHLEDDLNGLVCTFVAGFGGFAVIIFGVNSVGLAMLAFKGLTSPAADSSSQK